MKTLVRTVLLGAVGVVVLAVIFIALLLNPVQTTFDGIVFSTGEAGDVQSVSVRNQHGEFRFFFDFGEDGFVIDDIPPYLVDLEVFVAFMNNCANLRALHAIPIGEVELEKAGLLDPSAQVGIEFFDGSTIDLRIGAREAISNNYYALVNDSDYVYLISQALAQQFLSDKTQVATRLVTPHLALSSPLSAIHDVTFTGEGLERPITILSVASGQPEVLLAALSFGAPTHIVQGASNYQLDQTYGVEILGSLFGITGDIVGYNLNQEELAAFGLDHPSMIVEYTMTNGMDVETRQMRIKVAEAGDGRYYITRDDICAVFIVDALPFMSIQFERLPLRWFLTPLLMDLSAITIQGLDVEYRFEIDNTDVRNPIITYGEQELKLDLFFSFFRLLTSAAHDGTYLGAHTPPDGEWLIRITYEYSVPGKEPDVLTLYPGVERRVNVFINGAGEFAMRELFVQRVLEGSENLINGREIEENW